MARETVIILTDDLTGEKAEDISSVVFAIGGTCYEIDLRAQNAERLVKALSPFIAKAREIQFLQFRARFLGSAEGPANTASETDATEIRAWAKDNGLEVSERGRIPAELRAAFYKAKAEKSTQNGQQSHSVNTPAGPPGKPV